MQRSVIKEELRKWISDSITTPYPREMHNWDPIRISVPLLDSSNDYMGAFVKELSPDSFIIFDNDLPTEIEMHYTELDDKRKQLIENTLFGWGVEQNEEYGFYKKSMKADLAQNIWWFCFCMCTISQQLDASDFLELSEETIDARM